MSQINCNYISFQGKVYTKNKFAENVLSGKIKIDEDLLKSFSYGESESDLNQPSTKEEVNKIFVDAGLIPYTTLKGLNKLDKDQQFINLEDLKEVVINGVKQVRQHVYEIKRPGKPIQYAESVTSVVVEKALKGYKTALQQVQEDNPRGIFASKTGVEIHKMAENIIKGMVEVETNLLKDPAEFNNKST